MTQIKKTAVRTVVFQNGPNGGNPCPVILDGDDLTTEHGKRAAASFGAETILVLKAKNGDSHFSLRYFVPKYEMEMCVHGTIAATTVLIKKGMVSKMPVKFDTVLGQIMVGREEKDGLKITVYQFPPVFGDSNPNIEEVCSALRIPKAAINTDTGPVVSVSTSRPKLMVPISGNDVLDNMEPDFEMLWDLCDSYGTTGFYPFVKTGETCSARQFPKRAGYNEDPATGVAACALGSYLTRYAAGKSGWNYFQIQQGNAMGKPSLPEVGAYLENGDITETCVSGKARVLEEEIVTFRRD